MTDYAARRKTMVDTQVRPADVTKFPIIEAMLTVRREAYVPDEQREAAYVGETVDLGGGRVMHEPRTLAKLLDALNIGQEDLVLDIGCGLGYSSAVIARMAEAVVALEDIPEMATEAQALLSSNGADNVAVIEGTLAEGDAKHGPYDVIIIQGGVEQVPDKILSQLKDGGRIGAVFMDGALGTARIGYKSGETTNWRYIFNGAAPVLSGFQREVVFEL